MSLRHASRLGLAVLLLATATAGAQTAPPNALMWSTNPDRNAVSDPAVPAQDGASARSYMGTVRGVMSGVANALATRGNPNGIATLGADSLVPPTQMPNGLGNLTLSPADKRLIFKNFDGSLGYGSLLNALASGRKAVEQGDASDLAVPPSSGSPTVPTPLVDALRCIYPQAWGASTVATPARNRDAFLSAAAVAVGNGRPVCWMGGNVYPWASTTLPVSLAGLQVRAETGAVLRLADGVNAQALIVNAPNVRWSGGTFDGNAPGNPSFSAGGLIDAFADGFTLDGKASITSTNGFGFRTIASRTTVDDVDVSATKQTGIWGEALSFTGANPVTDFVIRNSRIVHTTQTLGSPTDMCIQVHATSKHFIRVKAENNVCTLPDASTFSGQTEAQAFTVMGIEFFGQDATNARLIDWKMTGNMVTGGGQGYSVSTTSTGTASGNTVRGSAWHGFEFAQNNIGVTLTGGAIDGTGAKGYAVWTTAGNVGATVSGVAMTAGAKGGFYGFNSQVSLLGGSIAQPNAAPAARCDYCTGSLIQGVGITGTPTEGVLMVGGTRNSIALNNIAGSTVNGIRYTDVGTTGAYLWSIYGNVIVKASGADISHAEFTAGSTCTGSRILGNVTPSATSTDWNASGSAAGNCP